MNADNVKPYGKLVHEAAEAGGVDKYCDAIEQKGYLNGAHDKENELGPIIVIFGLISIVEGAIIGGHIIKEKITQRVFKKAYIEMEAQKARDNLTDIYDKIIEEGDLDEEQKIIDEYTGEQDDIS